MSDVDELIEDIGDIVCRIKEKQTLELLNVFNNVRTCECGHKYRIQLVQDKMLWFQRMTRFYQLILGVLSLILTFLIYGFWLVRQYNRANIFGSYCSSIFWPFGHDCPVAF